MRRQLLAARFQSLWIAILAFAVMCSAQQPSPKPKPPAPTLGFNKGKDISPIIDADALLEGGNSRRNFPTTSL